jgi:putative transcriptional regulator
MLRRIGACLAILGLVVLATDLGHTSARAGDDPETGGSLAGRLLVAAPGMADPRFSETVIFMIDHDAGGARGFVVNRGLGEGRLKSLLKGFGVDSETASGSVRLHYGGPVGAGSGFVLHSTDYSGPSTRAVDGGIAVSTGRDILEAIADGKGPRDVRFILGYAGWGPGQLESEMARDDWLTAPAEPSLVFSDTLDDVWDRAIESAGISL